MPGFNIQYQLLTQTEEIQHHWLDLQRRADCSFFQSWSWIHNWLDHVVADRQVWLLQVRSGKEMVGLGLFVPAEIRRRLLVRSKALFLNEYPFADRNMVIESNGILVARGVEQAVHQAVVDYLVHRQPLFDEFHFGGLESGTGFSCPELKKNLPVRFEVLEESVCWQAELSCSHRNVDQFLASLGKKRRGQIRRSLRLYRSQGSLLLEQAETVTDALEYFRGLESLHTRRWQKKGKPGVFANPVWKKFHTDLISRCFEQGEIQLIRVSCGGRAIGYLYNFVWRKKVLVLQTGFVTERDGRLMPGYITHMYAMVHNYHQGMKEYDFLHGDDLYKRLLSSRQYSLSWVVFQRPRLKFRFENRLLSVVRACRSWLRRKV